MVSNIEKDFGKQISRYIDGVETQFTIKANGRKYTYDFRLGNKIIEFDGDYWHANPAIYEHDDYIGERSGIPMIASEMWALDTEKMIAAEQNGFQILRVWESDYKEAPKTTIRKCEMFLLDLSNQ